MTSQSFSGALAGMLDTGQIMSDVIPNLPTLGERLAWAREFRKVGVQELADAIDRVRQTVTRLENNTYTPKLDMIEALARRLDVSPVWLAYNRGMPFALPTVEAYLQSEKGRSVSPEAAEWLRDHSYRLFCNITPSDAEIAVALVLIARLLADTSQRGDGDRDR